MLHEAQKQAAKFGYNVKGTDVHFNQATVTAHRKLNKGLFHYLRDAKVLSVVTAPVIWSCVFPAVFLDIVVSFYQFVCFPVYGIPKVRREEYIALDRTRLRYLNSIEKLNCAYCAYVNGLIAYVQEIAGRTEQHWCPIKHAIRMKAVHSRYRFFIDYGDAEQYRARLQEVSHAFDDLKKD